MPGQEHTGHRRAAKFEMAVSGAAGHLSSTSRFLSIVIVNTNVFIMPVMESLASSSIKQMNNPSDS